MQPARFPSRLAIPAMFRQRAIDRERPNRVRRDIDSKSEDVGSVLICAIGIAVIVVFAAVVAVGRAIGEVLLAAGWL